MKLHESEILAHEKLADTIFSLEISVDPEIICHPGEFLEIYMKEKDTLLPRPFSISSIDTTNRRLRILYAVVGKGTRWLSKQIPGTYLKILYPLGKGFQVKPAKNIALIGGEVGLAPLVFLLERYQTVYPETKVHVFLGFRKNPYDLTSFSTAHALHIAAENAPNSDYFSGNVIDLLKSSKETFDIYFGCGPMGMLEALQAHANEKNIDSQISLDPRMGCGLGTCNSCVIPVKNGDAPMSYKRACIHGPVFSGKEVDFEQIRN